MMLSNKAGIQKVAENVLRAVLIGAGLFLICSSPAGTRRLLRGVRKEWNKRNTRLAIERLHKKKLVDYQEMPDSSFRIVATKKGKDVIRKIDLEKMSIEKPTRWDRKWRLVAFDISEERKKGREALRNMLYQLGFYKLQRSIFVHPYPCDIEIDLVRNAFEIRPHEVMIVVAESISQEARLKKFFRLQ